MLATNSCVNYLEPPRAAGCCTSCGMICAMSGLSLGAYLSLSSSGDSFVDSFSQVCQLSVLVSPSQLLSCTTWGKLMRILQPQTESGPRIFFAFFPFCFSFFFPVSYHSPIMWNCHFHFFILQSCASVILICLSWFPHVQLVSFNYHVHTCSFFAFCHHVLVIQHRKWIEAKSETEKIMYIYIYTKWEIKWTLRKKRQQNEKKESNHIP